MRTLRPAARKSRLAQRGAALAGSSAMPPWILSKKASTPKACLLVDAGNRNVREVANTRVKEPLSRRLRPVQVSARLRQRAPEPPTFSGDALASGFWLTDALDRGSRNLP